MKSFYPTSHFFHTQLLRRYTTLPYVALRYTTLGSRVQGDPYLARRRYRARIARPEPHDAVRHYLISGSRLSAVRHPLLWRNRWGFWRLRIPLRTREILFAVAISAESLGFSQIGELWCERRFAVRCHDAARQP